MKKIILIGLSLAFLGGAGYLAIFWPGLWIKQVQIEGNFKYFSEEEIKAIAQARLEEKLWQIVPQKSIFLIPLEKIKEDILGRFPEASQVSFVKENEHLLKIQIQERQSIGVWCQYQRTIDNEKGTTTSTEELEERNIERKIKDCYLIDKEGVIYRQSPLIKGSLLINLYSLLASPVQIQEKVVSDELIDFILALDQGLGQIKPSLKAEDFEIVSIEDLRVRASKGFEIYFNPSFSNQAQLRALELVLQQEIKEKINALEYIDLRIKGRVYYK